MSDGAITYKKIQHWTSQCRLWPIYQGVKVSKFRPLSNLWHNPLDKLGKERLLTPSNQVVVFHSHAVSAEHTDDHDIKMEPFNTHPSESRWEQIVQAYCYNTAKDLEE